MKKAAVCIIMLSINHTMMYTGRIINYLCIFMQNKNIALSRDRIFERVWNEEYLGDSRTVDLHIQRMRKKLGLEDRLTAVYKVGYRLEG